MGTPRNGRSFREIARDRDWAPQPDKAEVTIDDLALGARLRSMDALEKSAENQAKAIAVQEKILVLQERIAVAYEASVADKAKLIQEKADLIAQGWKREDEIGRLSGLKDLNDRLYRRIRSLKGVITRMKK